MKVTIFGLAGTGKSTVAKIIANDLNLSYNSTGNLMREKAQSLGMTIYEFDEMIKGDSSFDIALDKQVAEFGINEDNFIFESRLAWYFIYDSIKIKLNCDEDVVYRRISERESILVDEARRLTQKRANDVMARYSKIYPQIEFPPSDLEFDLVIDTTKLNVGEVVNKIKDFLISKKN